MLFYDINFVPFFFIAFLICYLCNRYSLIRFRNCSLLLFSYYFYCKFNVSYCLILLFVTIVNYIAAGAIIQNRQKWIVTVAVILSLIPLTFYKYTKFLLGIFIPEQELSWCSWVLPIGISFFTFQSLTYTIDAYRGKHIHSAPFIDYALFVAFFPNLLSGPIERARNILPQFQQKVNINTNSIIGGLELFIWGLFKKIVVADRCNVYTSSVFAHPDFYSGDSNALAIAIYAIQIYADFSGYSDMAIGLAKMLGFQLKANFLFPFFSTSLRAFWRKWHISLTSWFTEYVYISCGGNRVPKWRWYFNLSLIFVVSGIWHGAAWTYIAWGIIHAVLYILEIVTKQNKDVIHSKSEAILRGVWIFVLWALTLCVFRSETLSDAWTMVYRIACPWGNLYTGASLVSFCIMIACVLLFAILEYIVYKGMISIAKTEANALRSANIVFVVFLLLLVSLLGKSGTEFVYFKF